jgi:hypothetical protein
MDTTMYPHSAYNKKINRRRGWGYMSPEQWADLSFLSNTAKAHLSDQSTCFIYV